MSDFPWSSNNERETPYIEIIEQPVAIQKDYRFPCGSVPAAKIVGVNSTHKNKTYPTILRTIYFVLSPKQIILQILCFVNLIFNKNYKQEQYYNNTQHENQYY